MTSTTLRQVPNQSVDPQAAHDDSRGLAVTVAGEVVTIGPAILDNLRLDAETDVDWQHQAACADHTELFDAGGGLEREVRALLVCSTCPVMAQCRTWALTVDVDGVCGGLSPNARLAWQAANGIHLDDDTADYLGEEIACQEAIATIDTKQTGHGSARGRAHAVLVLANRGHNAAEIAEMAHCSIRSVNRLVAIGVHNYGMTLGPDAVIKLSEQPPVSIADRVVGGRSAALG